MIGESYNKFMVNFVLWIMMGMHVPSNVPWNLPHLKGWSLKQMRLHMIFIMNLAERLVLVLENNM